MSAPEIYLRPSVAAARLGVSVKALRLYEQGGLLQPARSHAGWRMYGRDDMARAAEILSFRALGLSLAEVAEMFARDVAGRQELLEAHRLKLSAQARTLACTIEQVHARLADLAADRGQGAGVGPSVSFELPWPWDGERFALAPIPPLTFITGPLGCGKTRLAIALAENLQGARFLGLDRLEDGCTQTKSQLKEEPDRSARVERMVVQLVEAGATRSWVLMALLVALDEAGSGGLVIDMVEEGLDDGTQRALIAALRQRPAGASRLFLMTRSNVMLDMAAVGPNEAIILCPANHSMPLKVAPIVGAHGYEAVMTCLASPQVRARTRMGVASSASFLTH